MTNKEQGKACATLKGCAGLLSWKNVMINLHELPKLRDSLSYLYVEHAILERENTALLVLQETGATPVPVANLCLLMLGPGTNITHAAVALLAESGCSILWTGQDMQLFYAQGLGETRRAYHLIRQAEMMCDAEKRLSVVMRMYEKRFGYSLEEGLSLEQIRGMEGARVRNAYAAASRKYNVPWTGRRYDMQHWERGDPINRALSASNALMNGICHVAIVSGGYSPALGFLHTGRQLSFVYDIADLYKVNYTIPAAFYTVSQGSEEVEKRARQICRELFRQEKLLERILPDIDELLGVSPDMAGERVDDPSVPEIWWDPIQAVNVEEKWS